MKQCDHFIGNADGSTDCEYERGHDGPHSFMAADRPASHCTDCDLTWSGPYTDCPGCLASGAMQALADRPASASPKGPEGYCAICYHQLDQCSHCDAGPSPDLRKTHIALNVALRRQGVEAPACDGPDCEICPLLTPMQPSPDLRTQEHPAILFNRWFVVGAAGDPFFPGLYDESQLRGVCYLAFMAGRESLTPAPAPHAEEETT